MTRKQFIEFQRKFYEEANELMMAKNADYSAGTDSEAPAFSNFEIVNSYPALKISPYNGAFIRLLDKISRLSRIINTDSMVKTESIRDTCLDISNYSSIICGILEEKSQLKDDLIELDPPLTAKNVLQAKQNKEQKQSKKM